MRLAKHQPRVFVGADSAQIHQYLVSQEAQKGIIPHMWKLLAKGVLRPRQSAWNTPLLLVKKPHSNDYCPGPRLERGQ